jgi:hypothetical protein
MIDRRTMLGCLLPAPLGGDSAFTAARDHFAEQLWRQARRRDLHRFASVYASITRDGAELVCLVVPGLMLRHRLPPTLTVEEVGGIVGRFYEMK